MNILAKLNRLKDGKGEGGGLAGNVAGDHDGGAELAQRPREGEENSADDSTGGEGEGDGEEDAEITGAESAGDLFEALIHLFKGDARRANQQWKGHDSEGNQHAAPGEHDVQMECIMEKTADGSVSAEEFEENESGGHGRHDEGEGDGGFDERFSGPVITREQPGQGEAKGEDDEGA